MNDNSLRNIDSIDYVLAINKDGLEKEIQEYYELMLLFDSGIDVSSNSDFKDIFRKYYKIRRNECWREKYFVFFQQNRDNKNIQFQDVIEAISIDNNVEASFASKMIATINKDNPLYDHNIVAALNAKPIYSKCKSERMRNRIAIYKSIEKWYKENLTCSQAKTMINEFDRLFCKYSSISRCKKLDFILWAYGSLINQ